MTEVIENENEDAATGASTNVAVAMREQADQELLEMIEGFGGEKGFQLRIYRTSPKKWGSPAIDIKGHIGTFEEWQTEEDLKHMYGGGTFHLACT